MSDDASRLAANPNSPISHPPTLRDRYSGIPERLLGKACKAKQQVFANQTKDIDRRARLPVIPKGITLPLFNAAIGELQLQLGNENVVVNDQPLVDGW